jgi:hypothetical protein
MKMRFVGRCAKDPREPLSLRLTDGDNGPSLIPSSLSYAAGRVKFIVFGEDCESIEEVAYKICDEIGIDIGIPERVFDRTWIVAVEFPGDAAERAEGYAISTYPSDLLNLTCLDATTAHPTNVKIWEVSSDEESYVSDFFDDVAIEATVISITERT